MIPTARRLSPNGEIELDVIECENGTWFVENRWGDENFETIDGILQNQ